MQEVICNALKAYVRLVQLKKTDLAYPTVLAKYGVAQVKDGRKVGGKLNVLDVMSTYCQQRKGVIVERLDQFDDENNQWKEIVVEDKNAGPAEVATTRVDFADWLKSLCRRDRRIAELLALGNHTTDVARRFKVCAGRVSQLRRELQRSWRQFVGEVPAAA